MVHKALAQTNVSSTPNTLLAHTLAPISPTPPAGTPKPAAQLTRAASPTPAVPTPAASPTPAFATRPAASVQELRETGVLAILNEMIEDLDNCVEKIKEMITTTSGIMRSSYFDDNEMAHDIYTMKKLCISLRNNITDPGIVQEIDNLWNSLIMIESASYSGAAFGRARVMWEYFAKFKERYSDRASTSLMETTLERETTHAVSPQQAAVRPGASVGISPTAVPTQVASPPTPAVPAQAVSSPTPAIPAQAVSSPTSAVSASAAQEQIEKEAALETFNQLPEKFRNPKERSGADAGKFIASDEP